MMEERRFRSATHGSGSARRRTLARTLVLAVTLLACGSEVAGPGATEGGGAAQGDGGAQGAGGSPPAVACEEAEDGEPCAMPGESCGAIECYGCYKHCTERGWSVSCTRAPTCETVVVEQAGACDRFCEPLTCGPFEVTTRCGSVSAEASCSPFGWFYELPCDPDCESLDQVTCGASLGCAWAVPCLDNPNTEPLSPRCIDFPPRVGGCSEASCGGGAKCVEVALSHELSSGDCSGSGALVALCVEP
jgi:hypothetical protein